MKLASSADNPGSSSYSYAIPVVHLPGRNGLDVELNPFINNSHVWNTTPGSSVLASNADRDFPDYGFRLDYAISNSLAALAARREVRSFSRSPMAQSAS